MPSFQHLFTKIICRSEYHVDDCYVDGEDDGEDGVYVEDDSENSEDDGENGDVDDEEDKDDLDGEDNGDMMIRLARID